MLGIRRQTLRSRSAHALARALALEKRGVALEDARDAALDPEFVKPDEHPGGDKTRGPGEDDYDDDDVGQLHDPFILRPLP
jgi:hypothetical protein